MADKIENENITGFVDHWVKSSDRDFQAMKNLFKTKNYNWSLFLGHLVIEKLLKALYIKNMQEHPFPTHDLTRIATRAGVSCPEEVLNQLDTITTFNINARYEDYKQTFYLQCTHQFTAGWIERITELRKWIKSLL